MVKLSRVFSYPKFPSGTEIFISHPGFQEDAASYISANFVGGSGTTNLARQNGISGLELRSRWLFLEPTENTYYFTKLNQHITTLEGWGKKAALALDVTSYTGNQSYLPSYITSNEAVYSGIAGHGGELQGSASYGNTYRTPNYWNSALMNRWKALIDALAIEFDGRIEYFYIDEMATQLSTTSITTAGGADAIASKQLELYNYAASKFINTTVFVKMNYLSGDNGGNRILNNIRHHRDNEKTFAVELAFPSVYDWKYPTPVGDTISYIQLDWNHEIGRQFGPSQRRYYNTDIRGSTWSDYTVEQCKNMLNCLSYNMQGCERPIYRIHLEDGQSESPGTGAGLAWKAIGPMIVNNYLRT